MKFLTYISDISLAWFTNFKYVNIKYVRWPLFVLLAWELTRQMSLVQLPSLTFRPIFPTVTQILHLDISKSAYPTAVYDLFSQGCFFFPSILSLFICYPYQSSYVIDKYMSHRRLFPSFYYPYSKYITKFFRCYL